MIVLMSEAMQESPGILSPEMAGAERPRAVILEIRHEETDRNTNRGAGGEDDVIQGANPTVPLGDAGRARAVESGGPAFAAFLAAHPELEVVRVITSEADRAKETADIYMQAAGITAPRHEDVRLNEQSKGTQPRGGIEDMRRDTVETDAYRDAEKHEGWGFLPRVVERPRPEDSDAETPEQAGERRLGWRDELTAEIDGGMYPVAEGKIPTFVVVSHNLSLAYMLGGERRTAAGALPPDDPEYGSDDMTVAQAKKLYRHGNGEILVEALTGESGQGVWNIEGEVYRPKESAQAPVAPSSAV